MKSNSSPSGVMLYAKSSGLTSFSSLWSIKHALGTDKVGHTGTLDSFADGLLVVLTGHLTHLVTHVTGFTKTYEAVVCFGKETDTLDPLGNVIREGRSVKREEVEGVLDSFRGAILQKPPLYSALHVDGKRASDIARSGKEIELESRQIFIYELELKDFQEGESLSYALLRIVCSKGTYIRSLARDIACALGTAGHVTALRRTGVGPFKLEDAACYGELNSFTIEEGIKKAEILLEKEKSLILPKLKVKEKKADSPEKVADIRSHFLTFTPELANICGLECDELKSDFEKAYHNGRPLNLKMFDILPHDHIDEKVFNDKEIAVFYKNSSFAGIIRKDPGRLSYGFVVPEKKRHLFVFTWQEIMDGAFPVQWKDKGSAVSVGCFDSLHSGHVELIKKVTSSGFVSGLITFNGNIKMGKEVYSLEQRFEILQEKGLDFVIAVDFDEKFSHLSGEEFLDILSSKLGLKFLAEGTDFKCGYKGAFDVSSIKQYVQDKNIELCVCEDVMCESKKVSTTRIKETILEGNFPLVNKMLLRPYEIILSGCKWKEVKTFESASVFETELNTTQMFPGNGIYKVCAKETGDKIYHTECEIDNSKVRLTLATMNVAKKISSMVFC